MATSAIGLDIGSSAVRAVQLTRAGKGLQLDKLGQVVLPVGAVRDGEILQPEAVTDAVRVLWSRFGFKGRRVALGLASQQVIVRQVDLPWQPDAQLRPSLAFQVQDAIPIAVDDALLDYQRLGEYQAADGSRVARLLLVAAARQMVDALLGAIAAAKLEPVLLDLDAFAMVRSLGLATTLQPGEGELVVNVGATVTNIVVHEGGTPRFVRILLLGGNAITESLQAALGAPYEQAEALKSQPLDPSSDEARLVAERTGRFVEEIRGSLDYYRAQADSIPVRRVVLSGGGALQQNLAQRLSETLYLPVEWGHPMQHLKIGRTGLTTEQLAEAEPFLAIAIGLAMGVLA